MNREIKLQDTTARGRNSWFQAYRVQMNIIPSQIKDEGSNIWLEVFSKRRAGMAPIFLGMSLEDADHLAHVLRIMVDIAKREKNDGRERAVSSDQEH